MEEIGIPSPVTPPPLPPSGPRPVLPLDAGEVPPPLPASHAPVAEGSYYKPPVFFEAPAPTPPAGGEPQWLLWGIGALVVVMIGIGAGFFVAVRKGPSSAVARNAPPPPAWKPIAPPSTRVAPVAPPATINRPRVAPATRPPATPGPTIEPKPPAVARPEPLAPLAPVDIAKALQGIELESVVAGRSPTCVINGRLYRTGHTVNGLTIDRINPDGVVLRHGDQRFEVKLKTP